MTKRLLLTIALGSAVAVIAAGAAGSATVDLGGGAKVQVPTGGALPACADLADNDGDGQDRPRRPRLQRPARRRRVQPAPRPRRRHGRLRRRRRRGGSGDGGGGQLGPGAPGAKGPKGTKSRRAAPPAPASSARRPPRAAPSRARPSARSSRSEPIRNPDGSPSNSNPGLTIAQFGAAPIGVPNFVIDQFEIPPFLLPIYQACGTEYGVPWQVLASINRIETAFGTNLNVSSAGALGWMQFIPSSWEAYGVDANEDGRKDPYNPVDAICAAGRYLKAAGAEEDLRRRDLRLQPRRLVRGRGPALRQPVREAPRRPGRLAHRPHRGRPLPGRRRRPLRRRHLRARGPEALEDRPRRGRQRRRRRLRLPHPPRHQHLLEG